MNGNPVRIGLVGAGPWGRLILKALGSMQDASVTAVASRNPQTAALVGSACRVSPDWKEVASSPDLDAVIVAVPPALHPPVARAAMEAGHAVFIEKPLALDPGSAQGLAALARERGVFSMVDHVHLFHPAWAALKRRAEMCGELRGIRSWGGNYGPFRKDTPPLWDYGPHDVALALDLWGRPPDRVEARLLQASDLVEGRGETIEVRLEFGGAAARLEVGNLFTSKRRRLEADYARGTNRVTWIFDDLAKERLVFKPEGGPPERVRADPAPPLDCALKAFLAAARAGSRDSSGLEFGARVVETLALAEKSLRR